MAKDSLKVQRDKLLLLKRSQVKKKGEKEESVTLLKSSVTNEEESLSPALPVEFHEYFTATKVKK